MQYLHREFDLDPGDVVEVALDGQANVLLMDPMNFASYKQGLSHRYYGGFAKSSPARLVPPTPGRWHVVVDLGGFAGTVSAGVSVVKAPVASR